MLQLLQRHRLFVIGIFVIVGATTVLLFFARDDKFSVGDVVIDPAARIDPNKTYALTLWEEEIVIPWAAKTQSEMLMEGISQFQELHPNVAISYSVIDGEEARTKLAESFETGTPPDVYGTAKGVLAPSKYQVPATPYLPRETAAIGTYDDFVNSAGDDPVQYGSLWLPAAAAMVRQDDVLWGWPKALWWETWLGHGPELADRVWTRDEFKQWIASEGDTGRPLPPPALNVLDVTLLEQWMDGFPLTEGDPDGGSYRWTESRLAQGADALRDWQREGLLPSARDAATIARSRLQLLFTGGTRIIGFVGPHLAQAIFRLRPDEYRLVPVPQDSSASAPPNSAVLDVGAYFVFRHERYEGDDHTRLAAELAAFLAAHVEGWLVESLGLLPVRARAWHNWSELAPLDEKSRLVLQGAVARTAPSRYSLNERLYVAAAREAVDPAWNFFWNTDRTGAEFAAEAVRALHAAAGPP